MDVTDPITMNGRLKMVWCHINGSEPMPVVGAPPVEL